jgi:hypothetical protein
MPARSYSQRMNDRVATAAAAATDERAAGAGICPRCGRDAPIVYRGVVPSCTACGAVRVPLSGASVNLAGKPARVGGAFATFLGILVLVLGETFALAIGLLAFALTTPGIALGLSLPIALASLVFGVLLLGGGRRLGRAGRAAETGVREQALLALAAERGGITAADGARVLGTTPQDADALLTALAKREPERLGVDIDDQGVIWFRPAGVRIGSDAGPFAGGHARGAGGVRIDATDRRARDEQDLPDDGWPESDAVKGAKGRG